MVHRITFTVDNQTPYYLTPCGQFAFWGEIKSAPYTVEPHKALEGGGGVLQAGATPWTGSAGIVGFHIPSIPIWIVLLGSDPDWGVMDNRARVLLTDSKVDIDNAMYNKLFNGVKDMYFPTSNGVFSLRSSIGTTDDCTATFALTFEKGNGVPENQIEV